MATDWTHGTLAELATVVMGTSPPGDTCNESGEGMPLLNGPTEFTSYAPIAVQFTANPVKTCQAGDILFCVRGSTTGRMNWADREYAIGRGLAAIRHRKGTEYQPFLRGVIQQHLLRLLAVSTGSTFPSVSRPDIENLSTDIPPPIEQRAIAQVLGTLDDKIELNRRMNETLEGISQAIFKSWFVDFDPVLAKAEGRDTGLPKQIADLFPKKLGDDGIPNGWTTVPLPDLIDVNPPRTLRKGEVAPYLDMANMPTRGHMPDAWIDRAFGSGMRFVDGDTLVARITPCLENGKTAFVTFLPEGRTAWGSTEFIVLRPKTPIPPVFAYCLARSEEFRQFAIQKMTGSSGRQRVPSESLSRFMIAQPPNVIFEAFGHLVEPLFARATANAMSSRTLAEIRDALLPKLLSGDLRVPSAERMVKRA